MKHVPALAALLISFSVVAQEATDFVYVPNKACPFLSEVSDSPVEQFTGAVKKALEQLECKEAVQVDKSIDVVQQSLQKFLNEQKMELPSSAKMQELGAFFGVKLDCRNYGHILQSVREDAMKRLQLGLQPPPGYEACFGGSRNDGEKCVQRLFGQKITEMQDMCGSLGKVALVNLQTDAEKQALVTGLDGLRAATQQLIDGTDCYEGRDAKSVQQSIVRTAIQVASLMSAMEPVSGVAGIGIGLAGATLNSVVDKYFKDGGPKLSADKLERDREVRSLACLYLDGSRQMTNCSPPKRKNSPPAVMPGPQFGHAHDYLLGNGENVGSVRRLTTIVDEVQKNTTRDLNQLRPLLVHLGDAMDRQMANPDDTQQQKFPRTSMSNHLRQIRHYFKQMADQQTQSAPQGGNVIQAAFQKIDVGDSYRSLDAFLNAYDSVQKSPSEESLQKLVTAIRNVNQAMGATPDTEGKPSPLDLTAVLDRYWQLRAGAQSGYRAMRVRENQLVQDWELRHRELLEAYRVVNRQPASPPNAATLDHQRDQLRQSYEAMLTNLKPIFVDQLKGYEKNLEKAMKKQQLKSKDESNLRNFYSEYLLPMVKMCALTAGAFHRKPLGELEMDQGPLGVNARATYNRACRRFQCEGGMRPFETSIFKRGNSDDFDRYECDLSERYVDEALKLQRGFIASKDPNKLCPQITPDKHPKLKKSPTH